MKFSCYTLGCKVNQTETQAMEQLLRAAGWEEGSFDEPCDCYILNTCTVTAVADKKNRNMLRRLRREHPQAVIGVCGCYAQLKPEQVRALGADVIGGSAGREEFVRLLQKTAHDRCKREQLDRPMERRLFEPLAPGGLAERTRAMLKVQDGCNNFCAYCIIPYARGPVRSLPQEEAVRQAKMLEAEGYREIVVTGIEIASWGWEWHNGSRLSALVRAICEAVPHTRIRLGSLEQGVIDEEFCAALRACDNLCPHFHLSLQSGCDTVLQRMRRKYNTQQYLEKVRLLQKEFPGCAVTTDWIVAFPGETEEEFASSLAFAESCGFASVHVFPYSRRPGTPADKMPGQHGNAVKQARSAAAVQLGEALSRRFRQAMLGTVQQVLFEERAGEYETGHAPNSVRVYAPGQNLHNQVCAVRLTALTDDGVLGELMPR